MLCFWRTSLCSLRRLNCQGLCWLYPRTYLYLRMSIYSHLRVPCFRKDRTFRGCRWRLNSKRKNSRGTIFHPRAMELQREHSSINLDGLWIYGWGWLQIQLLPVSHRWRPNTYIFLQSQLSLTEILLRHRWMHPLLFQCSPNCFEGLALKRG